MIVAVSAALAVVAASVVLVTTVLAAPSTPTPKITSAPQDPTNVTSATFTFNDSAPAATFSCAIDGGAFTACSSPKTYPGPFGNGVHTFNVRAQKSGSGVSSAESADWRVDTIAPNVSSITRTDANPASSGPLHWVVEFNESVSGLTTSNFSLATSGLAGHAPSLVSATPIGSSPATRWTVSAATTATTAVSGTVGLNLTTKAAVRDAAGNALGGSVPVTGQTYGYDTTAPSVVSITRADADPAKSGSLHWSATFNEPVTGITASNFRLSTSGLSGQSPSVSGVAPIGPAPARSWTITVSTTLTSAAHGTIGLDLGSNGAIRDAAGNALQATLPIAGEVYSYDSVAPAVTVTEVNGSAVSFPFFTKATITSFAGACGRSSGDSASVSVSITGSATGSGVVPCTTAGVWSFSATPALTAEGTYRVTATQSDTANNAGTSGDLTVVIDRTPPAAPVFTNTPAAATDKSNAQFAWRDSDLDVHFRCSLDGGAFSSCTSSGLEFQHLAAGSHCFTVVAIDAAENESAPATFCWTISLSSGLTISGDASQFLLPGAPPQALNLSISNPNAFAMQVTSLGVTITSQTLNGTCSTSTNFSVVHGLLVSVVIPAHSTLSLSDLGVAAADRPQIQMLDTHVNQDACRGATLHLNYTASAVKS